MVFRRCHNCAHNKISKNRDNFSDLKVGIISGKNNNNKETESSVHRRGEEKKEKEKCREKLIHSTRKKKRHIDISFSTK